MPPQSPPKSNLFSRVSKFLFSSTNFAWFWLIVRLYVGWKWMSASFEKITNSAWVGTKAGGALSSFLKGALQKDKGWYASFLQRVILPHLNIWSHIIAYGEFFVGIALILGIFAGIAAFFGSFMNINYLLAGAVSINPVLLILSIGIMFAWKITGYYGFDYYLLQRY